MQRQGGLVTRRFVRIVAKAALAAAAATLLAMLAIGVDGLRDHVVDADLAIVPGNTVAADGTPSERLRGRLDAAAVLYRTGRCKAILVSGGIDHAGFDEAKVMKAYLLTQGVREPDLYLDNKGINTYETARFAAALIRAKGMNKPLLVSQFFHISRMRLALHKQGIEAGGHVHSRSFELRDAYSTLREVFAYLDYLAKPVAVNQH
jgi:vancomycin permeability regulator SanA